MAAIKVANYQNVVNDYTNAQIQVAGVVDYYYDAAYEIVLLQIFDPEIDLLTPFYNAYVAANTIYNTVPQAAIQAVSALQNHILRRAKTSAGNRFDNIDDWLDANNTFGVAGASLGRQGDVNTSFKVAAEFASLSNQAGFQINASLIS